MLKNVVLAACLVATSMASHAALIEYNGYSRDSASNIVTGGGLEWLKWDATLGSTVQQAIDTRPGQGWRLASNTEVTALFNAFKFTSDLFGVKENVEQDVSSLHVASELTPYNYFLSLFGITEQFTPCTSMLQDWCYLPDDNGTASSAWFGDDSDMDGYINLAFVRDDYSMRGSGTVFRTDAMARLGADWMKLDDARSGVIGVALVRNQVVESSPVSLPGSISLIALGLVALSFRRRQASRR